MSSHSPQHFDPLPTNSGYVSEVARLFASVSGDDGPGRVHHSPKTVPSGGSRAPDGEVGGVKTDGGATTRNRVRGRTWHSLRVPAAAVLASAVFVAAGWQPETGALSETADVIPTTPIQVDRISTLAQVDGMDEWVDRLAYARRDQFTPDLERGSAFDALIRKELAARGLPIDLAALPLIESQFYPRARSSASAVGLWQFMEVTARSYGLRVDEWVDERRDPVASTGSALDYIVRLEERFQEWPLILAAYNAGPTRVARELSRIGEDAGYADIRHRLPAETRAYVPKALASAVVLGDPDQFGIRIEPTRTFEYDEVWVPGRQGLGRIASIVGVPLSDLRWLNPHLVQGMTPPEPWYPVRVPVGKGQTLVASYRGPNRRGTSLVDD